MPRIQSNTKKSESNTIEFISQQIQSGKINTFYLIHGEDHRLIKKYSWELLHQLIPENVRDGNFLQMTSKNCPVMEIIDFCDTLPFLAPRRVLLLENPPYLQQSKKIPKKLESEQEMLMNWLNQKKYPDSSFCIIFTFYEDMEKNTLSTSNPLYKLISKNGWVSQCPLPEEVFEFLSACSQKNKTKAFNQLQKLFDGGIDSSEIAYGLMSRLRFPLKRILSESRISPEKDLDLQNSVDEYNLSLVIEDKLRPRYQDILSENPQFVVEQWILELQQKSGSE